MLKLLLLQLKHYAAQLASTKPCLDMSRVVEHLNMIQKENHFLRSSKTTATSMRLMTYRTILSLAQFLLLVTCSCFRATFDPEDGSL